MSDLTAFLLARIDEDKKRWTNPAVVGLSGPWLSDLVLKMRADAQAKRAIVKIYDDVWMSEPEDGFPSVPLGGDGPETYYETIQHLAVVYTDHPDYRDEWRP